MSQGQQARKSGKALIALGSNAASPAGGPAETLTAAVEELRRYFFEVTLSRLYKTPAFPAGTGPDFVNAACVVQTDLDPQKVLARLHRIEGDFGRERTRRWGQRSLDLDLIACGQAVLPDLATFEHWRTLPLDAQKTDTPQQLILPHPRLQDRPFVLVPLLDVARNWCHPVLGLTVAEMLAAYPQSARDDITPIA